MVRRIPAPAPPAETETPRHSIPGYPVRHSGSVLVLGHGFTLHDDYARARLLRPDAHVIAVNKAAVEYRADHLFSWHNERGKLASWAKQQHERFGPGAIVHSTPGRNRETGVLLEPPPNRPEVDYWWPGALAGGSSSWMAVRMAVFMGYEERILCGVPLSIGGYADGIMARDFMREKVVEHYRAGVAKDTAYHAGTYSMSGATREILGEPC
jgi:hypothetical protein